MLLTFKLNIFPYISEKISGMKEMFQMEVVLLCTLCCVMSSLLVVHGLKFNMDLGRSDPV